MLGMTTMIPDAMRLPLTFGLSGALHAAALGFVSPPLPPSDLSMGPIQVRLLGGSTAQVAGLILVGLPDAETVQEPNSGLPQGRAVHAAASLAAPFATAATPVVEAVPIPESVGERERHSGLPDSAVSSPPGAAAPSPSVQEGAEEDRAAVIGGSPDQPGDKPQQASGVPAGTPAFPLQAPKALRTPAPEYPEEARWEKRTGLATLGFRIEIDGSVAEVRMLHSSGHADLDAAAMDSLRHWRFVRPPGAESTYWYRYVFRFELT